MSKEKFVVWSNLDLDLDDWRADLEDEYPGLNDDELIEKMNEINDSYGTEHSLSGNYHIEFEDINELFGVSLPDDKEMLDKIVDALDRDIVSDVDVFTDFDLMFYTSYCPNFEDEPYEME